MLISLACFGQENFFTTQTEEIATMEMKENSNLSQSSLSLVPDNYDLKYHRFRWTVDPAVNYIKGSVTSYFVPLTVGFSQVSFDMSLALNVDSIKYHGSSLSFTHNAKDLLQINLPSVIPVNTLDSITVYYQGAPVGSGLGSFAKTTHNSVPVLWTLSES